MKNLSHPNFSEAEKQRDFAKMKLCDDRNEGSMLNRVGSESFRLH